MTMIDEDIQTKEYPIGCVLGVHCDCGIEHRWTLEEDGWRVKSYTKDEQNKQLQDCEDWLKLQKESV